MKACFKDFEIELDYPDVRATFNANEDKMKTEVAKFLSDLGPERIISVSRQGLTITVFYWDYLNKNDLST